MRLARLILLAGLLLWGVEAHAMPQVVLAAAASYAGGAIAGAIGLTGIAASAFGAAFSFAVNSFSSSLFGRESSASQDMGQISGFTAEAQGRTQVVRSSVEPHSLVIGEVMKSGPLVYAETTGASNEYLHLVIPLAPHEVFDIGEVRFNDLVIGDVDGSGNVITGPFAGHARVKKRLGTAGQVADADLIAESGGKWTADHVGTGMADLTIRLKWNQNVFPTGIPNIKALVKGALLEDPRDNVTRFSNNWALAVRWYLKRAAIEGGLAAEDDEIDDDYSIAAANLSDERVRMAAHINTFTVDASTDLVTLAQTEKTIATGDGVRVASDATLPSGLTAGVTVYWSRQSDTTGYFCATAQDALEGVPINLTSAGSGIHTVTHWDQARYTCNGTIDTSRRPLDILQDLMTAGAGTLTYPAGKFRIMGGAYTTPVGNLTESELRGPMSTRRGIPRDERYNGFRGTYSNPANFWQPSDFPPVTNATYVTEDGEEIWRDINLPYTTDLVRAQRIAKIHLEESRMDVVTDYPGKLKAFDFAVYETANLSIAKYGWAPLVMRIMDWRLVANGFGVDLKLRKTLATVYDWSASDATPATPAPDSNLPNPFTVAAPGTPSVTEELYETTGSAGVKTRAVVSWAAAADAFVSSYEAQYKPQAASDWLSLAPISLTSAQAEDLAPGFYNFRVRAINSIGVRSDWSDTTTKELLGLTAPPAEVSGFSIIKSAGVGIAQFSLHDDLDVRIGGRIVVRWSPLTSGATWNDSIIFEEYNGDAVSGMIPLRTGTYMAKARDSTGVYSASAVSFVATEGLVTGFTTVGTLTEHTAFSGAKTNTAVVSSGLQLDGTTLIDSMVTSVDDWPFIDSLGGVSGTGSYAFTTHLDLTTVATRRFESTVAATQFDTGDLIDGRTDLIDDWIDIDGSTIEDCDATLYIRTTDDDPAGSPTWGAWTPFFVGDFTCRAAQFKLDLVSGNATHNIRITSLAVTAKVPT